jgi:hypothetical protein
MDQSKITAKMIKYLEDNINCENIIRFIKKYSKTEDITKLEIGTIPVSLQIIDYDDNDKKLMQNQHKIYDFMTHANYAGYEYFPYLYGVLNCHDGSDSKAYIFYESFDGDLTKLLNEMEHASEWYDIIFQLAMIDNYIGVTNKYQLNNATAKNILYKKLSKPIYKEYMFNDKKVSIKHSYKLVLWDINSLEKFSEDEIPKNTIDILGTLIHRDPNEYGEIFKINPSERIINLINKLSVPDKISSVLIEYYSPIVDA